MHCAGRKNPNQVTGATESLNLDRNIEPVTACIRPSCHADVQHAKASAQVTERNGLDTSKLTEIYPQFTAQATRVIERMTTEAERILLHYGPPQLPSRESFSRETETEAG